MIHNTNRRLSIPGKIAPENHDNSGTIFGHGPVSYLHRMEYGMKAFLFSLHPANPALHISLQNPNLFLLVKKCRFSSSQK
jgi:hypothetical protein